jgi:hypothetical protein
MASLHGETTLILAPFVAYLDPMTGSFIIQTIIGALLGAVYVVKKYYKRIKGHLTGEKPENSDSQEKGDADFQDDDD